MEWTDIGIVLGARKHGEANAILELMTREHGRYLGLVRGGAGTRMKPILQPGNSVSATWRARLHEHLGHFTVEPLELRAASFLNAAHAVYGITHLTTLCRLIPERDPHPAIYEALLTTIEHLHDAAAVAALVAQFELQLLAELGFGLDLSACAATGARKDLVYVSPKSGRAVSRAAGERWRDKLLKLPAFLLANQSVGRPSGPAGDISPQGPQGALGAGAMPAEQAESADGKAACPSLAEIAAAFTLTGFFLDRHIYAPRRASLPPARQHFIAAVTRALKEVA